MDKHGIQYRLIDKAGKNTLSTRAACFAGVMPSKYTEEYFVMAPMLITLSPNKQEAFLSAMNHIGFYFPNAEEIVKKKEYSYPIQKKFFNSDKTSKLWMWGNLWLYRYLYEFPGIVEDFLFAKKLLPTANLYHLLQLAHNTEHSTSFRFGSNHALMNYGWFSGKLEKFSSFSEVLQKYLEDYECHAKGCRTLFSMFYFHAAEKDFLDSKINTGKKIIDLYERTLNHDKT